MDCYLCNEGRAGIAFESWDLGSLKLIRDMFKTCPKHTELVERRIKIFEDDEPKKYTLKPRTRVLEKDSNTSPDGGKESGKKEVPQFMPPIQKEPIHDYNEPREREVNDGELIE